MKLGFAKAVMERGDDWLWGMKEVFAPHVFTEISMKDRTHDRADGAIMSLAFSPRVKDFYQRGGWIDDQETFARIEFEWLSTPALWAAYREGYDGAPDSHCKVGYGKTKYLAVVDLIEQECE
jgi:hypothetical protein